MSNSERTDGHTGERGRAIWIIDGSYSFHGSGGNLDMLKLKETLERESGDAFRERFFLTATPSPVPENEARFHHWLKKAPPEGPQMRVQLYELKTEHETGPDGEDYERKVEQGVDVGIATLALKLAFTDRYDRLVLMAGDSDLFDALEYVKGDLGKELWLVGWKDSLSVELQSLADRVIWLDDYGDELDLH